MIKNLVKCIGEYKKYAIIAPIFVIGEMAAEVIIPFLTSNLIDYGIDKGDMNYIIKSGIYILICTILSIIFGCIAGSCSAKASAGFAKNVREKMYENVQNFSFSNIDKYSTSSIITRLTTDVTNIQNAFQMLAFVAPVAPALLILSTVFAFRINVELALLFLACVPLLAVALYFTASSAHPIFTKVFKIYDKLNESVEENLNGIRVVKSFVREEDEKRKFFKISSVIYKYFLSGEKIIAFNMPLMQFSMYVCTILAAWFGARMIVAGRNDPANGLTTGRLLSLIAYSSQILMGLMILAMILTFIVISISSARRIYEILTEKSDITSPKNAIEDVKSGEISFKNVGFSYVKDKDKLCLKDINLDINSGEVIGITGGTGSGKSTLVHMIPRLYDATLGEVFVGGVNVKNYDLKTLRNAVAMVLQKNTLFSGTIKDNLRWGNEDATDDEMKRACQIAQADEFINNMPLKYDTYIKREGSNVSGGQKQRICIARALLKNPKILILDDSTSAVDTKTDALIRHSFKNYLTDTTKIIISQRISSVKHADKIIVIENGHVIGFDTHENLIKSCELYKQTYELQMKGGK